MTETFDYRDTENNPETIMRKELISERYQKIVKKKSKFSRGRARRW